MTTWVLLRGLARESRHWGDFPAWLGRLLPGERVIALDLPGNGHLNRQSSPCSVAAMVQACRASLEQTGAPSPFALIGLSLGGMVALQWSYDHPDELAGVVLINASFRGYGAFWQRLQPGSWLPLLGLMWPGVSPLQREQGILALTSSRAVADAALSRRWAAYATCQPVSRLNALRQLVAAARFRPPRRAPQVPMLMLASLHDRLVSHRSSRTFARRWEITLRLHPTAGHDLALDAPEWVILQVIAWWRRHLGDVGPEHPGTVDR